MRSWPAGRQGQGQGHGPGKGKAADRAEEPKTRAELVEARITQIESRVEQIEARVEQAETTLQEVAHKEADLREEISKHILHKPLLHGIAMQKCPLDQLTGRQRQVLQLIAAGHNTKQIGQIINI